MIIFTDMPMGFTAKIIDGKGVEYKEVVSVDQYTGVIIQEDISNYCKKKAVIATLPITITWIES